MPMSQHVAIQTMSMSQHVADIVLEQHFSVELQYSVNFLNMK